MVHLGHKKDSFDLEEISLKVKRSEKWCALTQDFTQSETRKSREIR